MAEPRTPDATAAAGGDNYNVANPVTWARAWMNDPLGGGLSEHWENLIESFRRKTPLGSVAPDFSGELLGGGRFTLSQHRGSKAVLVVFGSLACPPCVTNISTTKPSLVSLYEQYRGQVEICYVYTREAHPGSKIVAHTSMEQKRANAATLRQMEGITFPLVIDTLDGAIQRAWVDIQFNNPVFLVNRAGVVVYKSCWLDSSELPQVLEDVVMWDSRSPVDKTIKKAFSERIRPLREPFDTVANAKIKRLMEHIGLEQRAIGPIPGVESERATDGKEGRQ